MCDADGGDLFRNRVARTYSEARDGLVLVEAAVQELLGEALTGRGVRREVDLFGPPAQSFVVSAHPFADGGRCPRADRGPFAAAPDRDGSAGLRRQHQPRAQDADRRARPAGRDHPRRARPRGGRPARPRG